MDISAHELGYQYTILVTVSGTTYTIKVSPMSYVHHILWGAAYEMSIGTLDQNQLIHLQNAVLALYNYYKAERTYRGESIVGR